MVANRRSGNHNHTLGVRGTSSQSGQERVDDRDAVELLLVAEILGEETVAARALCGADDQRVEDGELGRLGQLQGVQDKPAIGVDHRDGTDRLDRRPCHAVAPGCSPRSHRCTRG